MNQVIVNLFSISAHRNREVVSVTRKHIKQNSNFMGEQMNKMIKILLSVMIVSLSALIIPLEGHSENIEIESVTVKLVATEHTENNANEFVEEGSI